jgi:cell division protein FtsB
MKMRKIASILTNKYLIAGAFFVVCMLFFDRRDFFQQRERASELKKLEAKKKYYVEEIDKARKELEDLQHNPAALEKYAREHYLMKKDGEDVFIIEDSAAVRK